MLLQSLDVVGPAFRQAERLSFVGLAASGLCRHRFIDEHLLAALPDVDQVLILGAGYDSRAYRFADEIGERPVYEVDLAPLSRRKAEVIAAHSELFAHASVRRVEIDFRTQSLESQLAATRLRARGADVRRVGGREHVPRRRRRWRRRWGRWRRCAGRGRCWRWTAGRACAGPAATCCGGWPSAAMALIGEPIGFSVDASSVASGLSPHGFEVADLAEGAEMTARYATGGRRCDPGMYVVAARLA